MLFEGAFCTFVTAVAYIRGLGKLPAFHLKIMLTEEMAAGTEAAVFPGAPGLAAQVCQGTAETVCTVVEGMSHASLFLKEKMIPDFL